MIKVKTYAGMIRQVCTLQIQAPLSHVAAASSTATACTFNKL